MLNWKFISNKFLRPWNGGVYDELCATGVGIIGDTMLVFGSTFSSNFTLWMSTNPKANEWKPLVDSFEIERWGLSFFTGDDGRLYMYNGSSNKFPMYGVELDRATMKAGQKITASVTVTDAGNRDVKEVVQLYIRDLAGSSTRPVKELKGFQKLELKAGESKAVSFDVTVNDLKFYIYDLKYVAEPGDFKGFVGGNSRDVKEADFKLN